VALVVSVPDEALASALGELDGARVVLWDLRGPAPEPTIDLVVLPYTMGSLDLARLEGVSTRLLQTQTLGYDNLVGRVPAGHRVANAVGVHEGPTAELAVALILASRRGLDRALRAQGQHTWSREWTDGLSGARVVLVGYGGVARAIAARLEPFGCAIEAVATRARRVEGRDVHGPDDLETLVEGADVVALAVPLSGSTDHLVDAAFLARLRDGALLVNVSRGRVVDTDALVAELRTGRLRAALDVVDPEPLPREHPLWDVPGLVLSPHVGGLVTSMDARVATLVRDQVGRLRRGEPPQYLVDLDAAS
jgi:phosphoglycerate dehydrogenase-like enzyme